jgi:hypothetical protein
VAELDQLLNAGVITLDTYTRGLVQAQEALERSSKSADVFTESVEKTETQVNLFAQQGAEKIFDAFTDFLFNPMEKGFDGLLKSFSRMLQQMAQEALKQKFIEAVFGGASGIVGGGDSGGAATGIASAIGGAFATRGGALEYHDSGMSGSRGGVATRSQAMTQDVSVTNVNVIDPSMVQQMLMTPDGQRAVLNVIRANRQVIL